MKQKRRLPEPGHSIDRYPLEKLLDKLSKMSWEKIVAIGFFLLFAAAAGINLLGCGSLKIKELEFVPILEVEEVLEVFTPLEELPME